jgi:precorrin-6Y C5,15-methyltransferase (decarboxylating)
MVEVVESEILQALSFLPVPDAVFVGGGVQNPGLLEGVVQALRPGGRLVVHAVLFKTMHTAMQVLAGRGLDPQILQVSCARGEQLAGDMRLVPLDPVFVISGCKPDFVSGDKV